jgi:NTP pyrophosphatase (non-canonical NTP hydrolase)
MPLNCDCYGGCWGDHSKGWPTIFFLTKDEATRVFTACWKVLGIPHGSYVLDGRDLRLETEEYATKVRRYVLAQTNQMSPNDYQREALRTERTPEFVDGDWERPLERDLRSHSGGRPMARLIHAILGVCTEAGELQDMVKKHLIYDKQFDRVNVLEEAGDVMWYLALALDACGFTMSEAMERNIAKLRARFPEKFTSEKALHRDLGAERDALENK